MTYRVVSSWACKRKKATVYQPLPIVFVPDDSIRPAKDVATFVIPQPYDAKGKLTEVARKAIIAGASYTAKRSGLRVCAVFGETDCVYCEPDGTQRWSESPPYGGIHIEPDGKLHFEEYEKRRKQSEYPL